MFKNLQTDYRSTYSWIRCMIEWKEIIDHMGDQLRSSAEPPKCAGRRSLRASDLGMKILSPNPHSFPWFRNSRWFSKFSSKSEQHPSFWKHVWGLTKTPNRNKFAFFSTQIPPTSQLFLPKLDAGPHSVLAPTGPDMHCSGDASGITVSGQFHAEPHLATRKQCDWRHANAQFHSNVKAEPCRHSFLHG